MIGKNFISGLLIMLRRPVYASDHFKCPRSVHRNYPFLTMYIRYYGCYIFSLTTGSSNAGTTGKHRCLVANTATCAMNQGVVIIYQQHLFFWPRGTVGESAMINFLPPMLIRSLRDFRIPKVAPPGADFCFKISVASATNTSSNPLFSFADVWQ